MHTHIYRTWQRFLGCCTSSFFNTLSFCSIWCLKRKSAVLCMLLLWNRPTYAHININNRRLVAIEVHLLFPLPHPRFDFISHSLFLPPPRPSFVRPYLNIQQTEHNKSAYSRQDFTAYTQVRNATVRYATVSSPPYGLYFFVHYSTRQSVKADQSRNYYAPILPPA